MVDARARRGLPERWLLPPAPRDEPAASRWRSLPFEDRRALARTRPDDVAGLGRAERDLVAGLARARLATGWRLLVAAAGLAWLVLMAVWGFGRGSYPASAHLWLQAGLVMGAITWVFASVAAAARLRRARSVLAATGGG